MAINVDPTNGETPLTTNPGSAYQYGSSNEANFQRAGSYYDQQKVAFEDFAKMFGRNPTQSELAMIAPSYAGVDENHLNTGGGAAAVASYYNSMANTPINVQASQTAAGLKAYQAGQAGFDATTNAAFQSATGRQATADELSHFGGLLASGSIDSYGLSQLVGQTAEAQNKQTADYQTTLSNNLQATQGDYYKNYINPSILSQTAAAGRDPNSSGVQQAEVQAGKQQNYDLQNYLAQFGASQYGQSAQNQQGVYGAYLQQQYNLQNAGTSQALGENSYLQNYNTNQSNYANQQNAYNSYLSRYGKSNGGSGALAGAASGAAAGTAIMPGWGTAIGGVAGGVAGYFGSRGGF